MIGLFVQGGVPVLGSNWREVDEHGRPRPSVTITAADPLFVTAGERMCLLVFYRRFEPALPGADYLDLAILRASVHAITLVAPTDEYPTTFASAWRGATHEERQHQMAASRGSFCGDHADPEFRVGEIIRQAHHYRCSTCGAPTLWYHLADEARTRACLAAFAVKGQATAQGVHTE